MTTTQSLWGERGPKGCNRFLHPPRRCFKKRCCLYFSGKGGPDTAFKKILQKQKNPKHSDDLNRAMRTGGQKLCANEMQNFALNNNKEIPTKKRDNFHDFTFCSKEYDFRTPSCVHFEVLFCPPSRDVKSLGFLERRPL